VSIVFAILCRVLFTSLGNFGIITRNKQILINFLHNVQKTKENTYQMPIIKSAKKRVRVAEKQSTQNAKTKRSLRDSIKAFTTSLTAKKDTTKSQAEAFSAIDTAVKKGVISKNKAARKKSQINSASKSAGTSKPGTKKSSKTAVKPAVKKSAPKAVAKKAPATKKPAKKAPAKTTKKK